MATPTACFSQDQASISCHLATSQNLEDSRTDLTPTSLALTDTQGDVLVQQSPGEAQQVKQKERITEDIGFDMDEMYQVLVSYFIFLFRKGFAFSLQIKLSAEDCSSSLS